MTYDPDDHVMHFPSLPGYVGREPNGNASSRWKNQGRNRRRRHSIPYDRKNYRILEELHRQFITDVSVGATPLVSPPGSVGKALSEFFGSQRSQMTASTRRHAHCAYGYYLDRGDLPLDEDVVYQHLVTRLTIPPDGRPPLSPSTSRKYLQRVNQFCRWCVTRGYFRRNPMGGIGIPKRQRNKTVATFAPGEVQQIVDWHRQQADDRAHAQYSFWHIQMAVATELLFLTGMRPGELLRARWEDIASATWSRGDGTTLSGQSWLVWGKADPTDGHNDRTVEAYREPRMCRDANARIRHIPLLDTRHLKGDRRKWRQRLGAVLKEARKFERRNGGWITAYRHTQKLNASLQEAMTFVGIPKNGRTLRSLRPSARWYMANVLEMDTESICDILGHSVAVSIESYRGEEAQPGDVARRLVR